MTPMPASPKKETLDSAWFKEHLLSEILPRWLEHSVTSEGLFLPHLDRQWRPRGDGYGTLVSQSRLLYNFSIGYELTKKEEYLHAIESGANFLIEKFRDEEYGGWFWSCNRNGEILDSRKDSYGHAFVIFGLSHACRTTGNNDFRMVALEAWDVVRKYFVDEHGGLRRQTTRKFKEHGDTKSQNPMMHLFEALLALGSLEGMKHILEEARKVADFVLKRLVRPGDRMLPETYSLDWRELSLDQCGFVSVGHAFEWAYLLSSAVEKGFPNEYLSHAQNFLEYGLRIGYDPIEGGVFSQASPDGEIITRRREWWDQCEATRALSHFAMLRKRGDLWEPLEKIIAFFKKYFIDSEFGGWYQTLEPDGTVPNKDKGNEWKVDYHAVGMCMEAIRLGAYVKR